MKDYYLCGKVLICFRDLILGITPFYFLSTGRSIIQPYMEDQLNAFFELYDPSIVPLALQTNFWPNLGTSVVSHAVTGFLLSPLDMLRIQ